MMMLPGATLTDSALGKHVVLSKTLFSSKTCRQSTKPISTVIYGRQVMPPTSKAAPTAFERKAGKLWRIVCVVLRGSMNDSAC